MVDPVNPFSVSVHQLAEIGDVRSKAELASIGGVTAVLAALGVDADRGLNAESDFLGVDAEVDLLLAESIAALHVQKRAAASADKALKRAVKASQKESDKKEAKAPETAMATQTPQTLAQTPPEKALLQDPLPPLSPPTGPVSNAHRRRFLGVNKLPEVPQKSILYLMWMAMHDNVLILLTVCAVASLAVGLYEDFGATKQNCENEPKVHWVEGFSILVAVLIVLLAGSINDFQKEKQFRKLNAKKDDRKLKAIRDGEQQLISVYHILAGDILVLEPGDMIVADGIFISGHNLRADESAATGESDSIKKGKDLDPFFLSGSKIIEGVGKYVVTAVGIHSFHGKTMMALRVDDEGTPLQVKLEDLAEKIAKIGAAIGGVMFASLILKYVISSVISDAGFGSGQLIGSRIISILIATITIVVVAVPEGLPLAVTLALAYAMTRMQRDNNLVRVLAACETMGGATTICSDKTGTLTQNKMTVVKGSLGRLMMFEEMSEVDKLAQRCADVSKTDTSPSTSSDTLSASSLFAVLMENIAINSSAFEGIDEAKGLKEFIGSKTECALLLFSEAAGMNFREYRSHAELKTVQVYPFSSERKSMSTIVKVLPPTGKPSATSPVMRSDATSTAPFYRVYVKGASEIVLKYCERLAVVPGHMDVSATSPAPAFIITPGMHPLDAKLMQDLNGLINKYAEQSLRTICLAYRDISETEFRHVIETLRPNVIAAIRKERADEAKKKNETDEVILSEDVIIAADTETISEGPIVLDDETILTHPLAVAELVFQNLTCIGIVGIEDPLRPGVPEAVLACQRAGVMVRMVTGDNILTAKSIAARAGIYTRGGIVIEGAKFRKLSVQEMDAMIPRLQVMARSSPTDKQLLVGRLKALGETVAVTGDGTNDGPALKMADVGFSMGIAGTPVAQEASSIVLLDDNFASIVKAIMWGRCVSDSVKKFLQFQLTVNVTAVLLTYISAVADADQESVLTAVQLLWVNLLMDTLAALALATDRPTSNILDRPPENKQAPLITIGMWKMILGQALYQLAAGLTLVFAGPALLGLSKLREQGGIMNVSLECMAPLATNSSPSQIFEFETERAAMNEKKLLRAMIFNTFVFMQIFNMINCRTLDNDTRVFRGIHRNPIFIGIFVFVVVGQIIIVYFGGPVFKTEPLSGGEWAASVLIGVFTLLWGFVIRILPDEIFFCFPKPGSRSLVPQNSLAPPRVDSNGNLIDDGTPEMSKPQLHWAAAINGVQTRMSTYKAIRGGGRVVSANNLGRTSIEGLMAIPVGVKPAKRLSFASVVHQVMASKGGVNGPINEVSAKDEA